MATPEFTFKSAAYAAGTFTVVDFQGTEAISSLFRFDIGLKCPESTAVDLKQLLEVGATLSLEDGAASNVYAGMLAAAVQQQQAGGFNYYRVLLVPPAWKLSLNRSTAGFVGAAHPTVVQTVLGNGDITTASGELNVTGITGKIEPTISNPQSTTSDQQTSQTTATGATQSLNSADYTYPAYDFICQYAESDLDFACRLLEYEGIYFYFEDTNGNCTMMLADGAAYPELKAALTIPFTDPSSTNNYEAIVQISRQLAAVTNEVSIAGYNYLNTTAEVLGSADVKVDGSARGGAYPVTWLYDNRVQTQAAAQRLAVVRAEEQASRADTYTGRGAVCALRAGYSFKLEDHPVAAFNQSYLITGVQHSARNLDQSWTTASYTAADSATNSGAYYSNSFTAIPAEMQFRPQRTTPKPRIAGVLSATVYVQPDDGSGGQPGQNAAGGQAAPAAQPAPGAGANPNNPPSPGSQGAQVGPPGYVGTNAGNGPNGFSLPAPTLDDQGRYLVYLPFADGTVRGSSMVSAWIRMAQPSAGLYTGSQYTLEPGAEVLLAFVNGDPDLPVIVGSVYNGAIPAPLTSANVDPQV